MSDIKPVVPSNPKSSGLFLFFYGFVATAVIAAVIIAIYFADGHPDNQIQLGILVCGGLGLLMMLLGIVKELVHSLRTGQFRGLALQLVVVAVVGGLGYFGWRTWAGAAVAGDELATLLGKKRDDPAVKSAISRLGMNSSQETTKDKLARLRWDHGVALFFDKDDTVQAVEFSINKFHPYAAGLPLGLIESDDHDAIVKKLGPADSEVTKIVAGDYGNHSRKFQYYAPKNLAIVWSPGYGSSWEVEAVRITAKAP